MIWTFCIDSTEYRVYNTEYIKKLFLRFIIFLPSS